MKARQKLKIAMGTILFFFLLGGMVLGVLLWDIKKSVGEYCRLAQQSHPHPGDDAAALLEYLNSREHTIGMRNLAVWALGRLRDPRALPALKAAYTGGPCRHDEMLCQYELEKAIRLCGGVPEPSRS